MDNVYTITTLGNAAFEKVAYPMPELKNPKLVRKVKRSLRAPMPPSQMLKKFLLTYNG